VDDYLGYVAKYELGSQYLVGAFSNPTQIIGAIGTNVVIDSIVYASNGHMFEIPSFLGNNSFGDNSALWVLYSSVFANHTDRLTSATDGVRTSLFHSGDVIVVKMTVNTPALDSSITSYSPSISADSPSGGAFTPSQPPPRIYKIRITLV
jgi:hypothetical protein